MGLVQEKQSVCVNEVLLGSRLGPLGLSEGCWLFIEGTSTLSSVSTT